MGDKLKSIKEERADPITIVPLEKTMNDLSLYSVLSKSKCGERKFTQFDEPSCKLNIRNYAKDLLSTEA